MPPAEHIPDDSIHASAMQTYDLCPRKWAWDDIERIPRSGSNHAAWFGTAVHAQIERWLRDAIPFDLTTEAGECALACLHLLPKPRTPGMLVENPFTMWWKDIKFQGTKDLEFVEGERPTVWDHKTSSAPKRWGLTTETLPENIQAVLYAVQAMVRSGSDSCDLVWNYLTSKRPYKAYLVRVTVTRESVQPTLKRITELASEMVLIRNTGLRALDLPFNPSACEAYGGCPYRELCNLSADDRLRAIMSDPSADKKAELLARLGKKAAQGAGSAVNPPVDTGAGTFVLPAGGQMSPDGSKYWAPGMTDWAAVPQAPAGPPALPQGGPPPLPGGPPALPQSPAPWTLPAGGSLTPDGKQFWAPGMSGWENVPQTPAGPPALASGPPALPQGGPPPLPDAPAKRGRPKGAKNKTKGDDDEMSVSDLFRALAEAFDPAE